VQHSFVLHTSIGKDDTDNTATTLQQKAKMDPSPMKVPKTPIMEAVSAKDYKGG